MGKKVRLRKDEGGYALALVLILLILVGLIIGPLLLLMTTSLMSAYRHEEGMLGFYAADAGIEDAAYKIQIDYCLDEEHCLPQDTDDDPLVYTIEDVNGNDVEVNIQLEENVENFLEGLLGGDSGPHPEWTTISENVTAGVYTITVAYSGSAQNKRLNGVGAWLEGDYGYVADSASGMTDDYSAFTFRTESYKGGTAFIWEWGPATGDKPAFGLQTGIYERSLTFEFTLAEVPPFHFSWLVGSSMDIGVVPSAVTFGIWIITATAIDSVTGKQTEVISYLSRRGGEVHILTYTLE